MDGFIPDYLDKELPEGSDIKSLVKKVAEYFWKRGGESDVQNWVRAQSLTIRKLPLMVQGILYENQLNHELKVLAYLEAEKHGCCGWDMALEKLAKDILGMGGLFNRTRSQ